MPTFSYKMRISDPSVPFTAERDRRVAATAAIAAKIDEKFKELPDLNNSQRAYIGALIAGRLGTNWEAVLPLLTSVNGDSSELKKLGNMAEQIARDIEAERKHAAKLEAEKRKANQKSDDGRSLAE